MPRNDLLTPNLEIKILFGNGIFTNDRYGNPVEGIEESTIFARVSQSKNPLNYQMPGIQITDIFLRGNIVSLSNNIWTPSTLPSNFSLEDAANATLNLGDREYIGKFKFLPIVQPVFPSLALTFGEVIFGYLNLTLRN